MSSDRREYQKQIERRKAAAARDINISPLPDSNKRRRARFRKDLIGFTRMYFSKPPDQDHPGSQGLAYLPLSELHVSVLTYFQERILFGGQQAVAAPRGFGKDTMACIAAIWATFYGHANFFVFACYEAGASMSRIETIKSQIETNSWLGIDFPEVCGPAKGLERAAQRAKQQTYKGEFTRIEWGKDQIILPTIKGSKASGAIIAAASLNGSIRGLNVSGRRPDFVAISDPQTAEVAKSQMQIDETMRKIKSDFGGLGAVDRPLSSLALVTIIRRHDVADQLTDRTLSPQWSGLRFKALECMPDRMDLWEQYEALMETGKRNEDPTGREACQFYLEHQAEMDAGAAVAWKEAFIKSLAPDGTQLEYSALQHFMNQRWQFGEEAFATEYQNEPIDGPNASGITAELVASRLSLFPHQVAPKERTFRLVQAIDIGGREIHYLVLAYGEDGSAAVIDYDILRVNAPDTGSLKDPDGATRQALERAVLETLRNRRAELQREVTPYRDMDGNPLEIHLTVIDSGWGALSDAIYLFCRESGAKWRAIKGHQSEAGNTKYIGARTGTVGDHWHATPMPAARIVLWHLDADYYKMHVQERFLQTPDTPGAWAIYGNDPREHRMFSRHMVAEEWDVEHNRYNKVSKYNHFFDCAAYAAAAASMTGIKIITAGKAQRVIAAQYAPAGAKENSSWKIGR